MKPSDIILKNDKKIALINTPYDPVTGEGCCGERVALEIKDAPFPLLYIPVEMMETQGCKLLKKYGSFEKLYAAKKEPFNHSSKLNAWIRFCELRYSYDFEYFAIVCQTIQDKISSKDIKFRLNRGQRRLLARLEKMRKNSRPIRIILLKARQWGGSTLIQLYMDWIQMIHRENWNSVICAHVKDAALNIRAMYKKVIDNMIPIEGIKYTVRPFEKTQNIQYVPERGCRITVGSAEEPESARSQDAKMCHFSEISFYPDTERKKTSALITTIVGSIPRIPYTLVAYESTANGVGDFFHTEWTKAENGESAFDPVFVPWYMIDIYSEPFDGTYYNHKGKKIKGTIFDFAATLDEYETNLFINHEECTLENINWYRGKLSEMPSLSKMKQEYPSDSFEAFQDSGQPVLRSEDLEAMRKDCKPPKTVGKLSSKCDPAIARLNHALRKDILQNINYSEDVDKTKDVHLGNKTNLNNLLKVWEHPQYDNISNRYIVIYDPSKGKTDKADFGVIVVIDRYWRMFGGKSEIVAEWRGHEDKDIVIWFAAMIAKWYDNALLVIESNTYTSESPEDDDSEFIFDTIADYYSNLYARIPADKVKETVPVKYGFNTNRYTKPMIIANYIAIIREHGYIERNYEAIDEGRVYEKKKNGKYGAKQGKHDDIIMTRFIGCYIDFELPLPQKIIISKNKNMKRIAVASSI